MAAVIVRLSLGHRPTTDRSRFQPPIDLGGPSSSSGHVGSLAARAPTPRPQRPRLSLLRVPAGQQLVCGLFSCGFVGFGLDSGGAPARSPRLVGGFFRFFDLSSSGSAVSGSASGSSASRLSLGSLPRPPGLGSSAPRALRLPPPPGSSGSGSRLSASGSSALRPPARSSSLALRLFASSASASSASASSSLALRSWLFGSGSAFSLRLLGLRLVSLGFRSLRRFGLRFFDFRLLGWCLDGLGLRFLAVVARTGCGRLVAAEAAATLASSVGRLDFWLRFRRFVGNVIRCPADFPDPRDPSAPKRCKPRHR